MTGVPIPVAVSARHVHLSERTIGVLFGAGYALHPRTALSQPGQYAAQETVTLIGPKGSLTHVRIVGPPREADQVEISRTDEITLGLNAPIRLSGELEHTPGITLEGPAGRVELAQGVVLARRHVHMTPEDAVRLGVHEHQMVRVAIEDPDRALVFDDVIVRTSPQYRLELHLDTDEANASGLRPGDRAILFTTAASGSGESPDV